MDRDLQLLFELGTLRFVPRTWNQFGNPGYANVSEHVFRMAWTAMVLAKREGADLEKVLKLVLFHDVTESRTGDVHILSRRYVTRDDEKAITDIFAGTSLESEALDLFNEYRARTTLESKVVKDADLLDVDLELREQTLKGGAYPAQWHEKRKHVVEHELHTESAKKLWHEINGADAYGWFTDAIRRNDARDAA